MPLPGLAYALSRVAPTVVAVGLTQSLCTIFAPDGVIGTSGAPSGLFTTVVLANIICMDAPISEGFIRATQERQQTQVELMNFRHVWLSGPYYPQLYPLIKGGLQAQVTDASGTVTNWNVFGAEPDSQGTQCRLHLEEISV